MSCHVDGALPTNSRNRNMDVDHFCLYIIYEALVSLAVQDVDLAMCPALWSLVGTDVNCQSLFDCWPQTCFRMAYNYITLFYRDEVERLSKWCEENNLLLKTKDLIIDCRRKKKVHISTFHQQAKSREGCRLQISRSPDWEKCNLEHKHLWVADKGSAEALLPQGATSSARDSCCPSSSAVQNPSTQQLKKSPPKGYRLDPKDH